MAFTGFIIGAHIDRYGGRPFIVVGAFILAAATFSLGSINNLAQWWIINGVILTMGAAMIGNLVINVSLGKWFVERRGRAVAIAGMGISLGGIMLPPIATWLVDIFGWRESWRILGLITILVTSRWKIPRGNGLRPWRRSKSRFRKIHDPRPSYAHIQFLLFGVGIWFVSNFDYYHVDSDNPFNDRCWLFALCCIHHDFNSVGTCIFK